MIDIATLAQMEADLANAQPSEENPYGYQNQGWSPEEAQGLAVYSCQSCGGEIIGDETLGSTSCPFCGNPVVMTSKFSGAFRPDVIIPFKLGKDAALEALKKHYLGKKLLPKVFQDKNHLEEIKGVYVPFWLYSADTHTRVDYDATKVRTWTTGQIRNTETSHFYVLREGNLAFDYVPVDGSAAMDNTLMESIEPYNMTEGVPFATPYLAGFYANKYDVDSSQGVPRANERMERSAERVFRDTVAGYDSVTAKNTYIWVRKGVVYYAMMPVWMLTTRWQDKGFTFAMNGQTGKLVGDLPVDKAAANAYFWKLFGIWGLILLVLGQLLVSVM